MISKKEFPPDRKRVGVVKNYREQWLVVNQQKPWDFWGAKNMIFFFYPVD